MEENTSTQAEHNASKRGPLENLGREELIKKCKGLLTIAQKAKQAKDDYAEENRRLKDELNKYENQKEADKKALIAMKEMVDNLTENKLALTTQISDLKAWKVEIQKELDEKVSTLSKLQIENEALNRQIKRLTEENEELLSDLDNMENKFDQVNKFSVQQQEDLVKLEKEVVKWKEYEIVAVNFQKKFEEVLKENEELKIVLQKNEEIEEKQKNCDKFEEIIKQHKKEIEKLKTIEKDQNEKIQTIKGKLITVAMKLKNLKASREILLETIQDYSESLSTWQKDIFNVSSHLCDCITNLEKDKKNLLEEKKQLEEKLKVLSEERQDQMQMVNELKSNDQQEESADSYNIKLLDVIECCEKALKEFDNTTAITSKQIENLEKENELKQQALDGQTNKIQELTNELKGSRSKIEELEKNLSKAMDTKYISEELEELKDKLEKQNTKIAKLSSEEGKYSQEIANLQKVLKENETKLEQTQKEYRENCKKLQIIQESYDLQSSELERCQKLLSNSEEIKSERLLELEEKLTSNEKQINRLEDENKNLSADVDRLQSSLKLRETENSDLLTEMRELNEALKGRGDVISRQQEKIKELELELKQNSEKLRCIESNLLERENQIAEKEIKIDKMNEEINSTKDEVANLSQQAKENEKVIRNLSDEVISMRDKIPGAPLLSITETQSEILSTSTYSKADETSRMREVDESLEEKYGKLRVLAIKLKKKVQEQAAYIANLENDNQQKNCDDQKKEITSNVGNINVQVKNLQALQNENDKLLDEVERLKKENSNVEKQVKELNEKVKILENQLEENEKRQSLNKDEKSTDKNSVGKKEVQLENAVREYQSQIKFLKQEKDSYNVIVKELEKEKEKLRNTLTAKENEIETIKKQCEKIKSELEKKKAAEKKSSVLNLEIEAYEKSLNEITKKLEAKTNQIDELTATLKVKEEANQSLQEQIKLLEESLESEKAHSQELKQQVDIHQAKIKENEYDKHELKTKIQDLTLECETLKSEVDNLRLQLSEVASEKDKLCISLQNDKEKLLRQVLGLEEALDAKCEKLKETERELEDLRANYASYKIKAQSVLRQNQTKETSRERELEEEITAMHSTIESLKLRIKSLTEQIENNERKFDDLRQDNERIQKRCKELIDLLEESRLQNDALLEDNKKQSREYQESLKAHRLQIETLTNAYKRQIEDIEQKHLAEVEELKKRGITTKENRLVSRIGPFGEPEITDEQKIDLILMEREDAEGSETNVSIPKRKNPAVRSKHDLIPLDELLNSNLDINQNDEEVERSISPTLELQNTKERLHALENQVKHLTSLLAETEQDLAKLTQLNEVLKEEVRRHERAVEREKHMHNSEYMKNVVLKFLTLNSGDERSRLVPVLNTIFKLSPEETQTLQSVARGSDNIHRGWGSYLPIWSNHQ